MDVTDWSVLQASIVTYRYVYLTSRFDVVLTRQSWSPLNIIEYGSARAVQYDAVSTSYTKRMKFTRLGISYRRAQKHWDGEGVAGT